MHTRRYSFDERCVEGKAQMADKLAAFIAARHGWRIANITFPPNATEGATERGEIWPAKRHALGRCIITWDDSSNSWAVAKTRLNDPLVGIVKWSQNSAPALVNFGAFK